MIFIIESKTIYTFVILFKRRLIKHVILWSFKILPPKFNQIKLPQIVFLFCCKNCIILIKYLSVGTNKSIWAMWACVYVLRFLFSLNVWMGIHKALVFLWLCVLRLLLHPLFAQKLCATHNFRIQNRQNRLWHNT